MYNDLHESYYYIAVSRLQSFTFQQRDVEGNVEMEWLELKRYIHPWMYLSDYWVIKLASKIRCWLLDRHNLHPACSGQTVQVEILKSVSGNLRYWVDLKLLKWVSEIECFSEVSPVISQKMTTFDRITRARISVDCNSLNKNAKEWILMNRSKRIEKRTRFKRKTHWCQATATSLMKSNWKPHVCEKLL